jgi:D-alanine-D-alanine ligase
MKKKVAILFGGISAEHEVSIISGLQVFHNIDKDAFIPYVVKLSKNGVFEYYKNFQKKTDYLKIHPQVVNFAKDQKGVYFYTSGLLKNKIYIDVAYLAFHGGNGESGQIQGFLEILGVPYTSPSTEASVVAMNKMFTKQILNSKKISTVDGFGVTDQEIIEKVDQVINTMKIKLPVIVKPAHLGSSIGINIAKTKIELKKYLLEAAQIDNQIIVEQLIENFSEYNISVRRINGKIETSEIEKPISKDKILSFADKYERGGKKTGGMVSLNRELPAKISKELANHINNTAVEIYKAINSKGLIRIDFMVSGNIIYVTEVNPIPGSMSYYLWEAKGVSFKQQITDLINQAIIDDNENKRKKLEYETDIVKKYISSTDR